MKKMEWIKIDPENLPTGEVLAANFLPDSYGYKMKMVGKLYFDDNTIGVQCENEEDIIFLPNCTHYIDLNQFDL